MSIATKYTRGAVAGNAWTNAANATAEDDTNYATCSPAKKGSVSGDWDFAAFTDGEIPASSTINSVTIRANYKVDTTSSIAELDINPGNNGSFDGVTADTSEPTTDTDFDVAYATAPSETDLKTAGRLVARIDGVRGNSNTAVTFSLDSVALVVDYTAPAQTFAGSDTVSLTETDVETVGKPRAETVSLTESFVKVVQKIKADTISLGESFATALTKFKSLSDTVSLTENLDTVRLKLLALDDTIGFTETFVRLPNKVVGETVALTETYLLNTLKVFGDTLGITEAFTKFIGGTQAETVVLTENLTPAYTPGGGGGGGRSKYHQHCKQRLILGNGASGRGVLIL